jgi:predicted acyltransferase
MKNSVNKLSDRVLSVDVLRGFDMFWIIGGEAVFRVLFVIMGGPFNEYLAPEMYHTKWIGFTFYDLIFPLFVFIVGMSVVFSLGKYKVNKDYKAAYKRIFKRFVILFLLGVLYNGALIEGFERLRLMGVLQRLAITYLVTGILYLHFDLKKLIAVTAAILLGYWILISFIPAPGLDYATNEMGKNWADWFDQHFLPFHLYRDISDPEGLLSTVPAIASSLLGLFASLLLINKTISMQKKAAYYIGGGIIMTLIGFLWGLQFPVIKNIWTSSYVLVAGGYSFLLFGVMYLVLDVWKIKKWATPFVWIGMNPIFIYMFFNIVELDGFAQRFIGKEGIFIQSADYHKFFVELIILLINIAIVRFLYKKKIFIKI